MAFGFSWVRNESHDGSANAAISITVYNLFIFMLMSPLRMKC